MAQQITLFEDVPLPLTLGGELSPITVAYQTYGRLNAEKSNAVLLCHALTGDAKPYYDSPTEKGWWQDFIGKGLAFDTDKYFFICSNVLGGCKGTTGPASINLKPINLTVVCFQLLQCKILLMYKKHYWTI